MEGESGVTRSNIDELHFSDNEGDQIEGENSFNLSIIHGLDSSDTQGDI